MVVPGWILLATAAVVVGVAVFLCLVIRRALTELFFWRGAYWLTSERAVELLQRNIAIQPQSRAAAGAATRETPTPVQRYEAAVSSVRQEAARLKIDWVSEDDGAYYRAQHDTSALDGADPPISAISRIAEFATRR